MSGYGIKAPSLLSSFPGASQDYGSMAGYGGGYSPVSEFLPSVALPTQYGAAATGGGASAVRPDFFSMDGLLGYKNADGTSGNGWGGVAMGLIQGLGNAYMGMKQYGLAKDQLAFSKQAFERNFGAQRAITNANLEDRQRARVASNPGAYQSVGEYMQQNGVR